MFKKNRKKDSQEKIRTVAKNRAVLDQIVPSENFDFAPERPNATGKKQYEPMYFKAGRTYRQIMAIRSFPSLVDIGWGVPILSRENTSVTIHCELYDKEKLKMDIDRQTSRDNYQLNNAGATSKIVDLSHRIDHSKTILEMVGDEDEPFFATTIYQTVMAPDEKKLQREVDYITSALKGVGITPTTVSHNQYNSFLGASPLMLSDPATIAQTAKPMPASTLGAMGIFRKTGLYDPIGTTIGKDSIGGPIRLNMLTTNECRGNRNIVLTGDSGVGKTTLMQKIMLDELARGALVIVIDPEREQREFCEHVGGQWINLGGASNHHISPFRLRTTGAAAAEIEEDAEAIYQATQEGEVLSETVSNLRTFFQIAFGCTRAEIDYLEKILKEEYEKFGITYNTPLKNIKEPNKHPLMNDIYKAVEEKTKSATGKAQEEMRVLAGKLWPAVEGSFSNLWNTYTNVTPKANLVVLDTYDLNTRAEAIKAGQYFNILTWVWDLLCRARITGRPIRLVIDECHLALGRDMENAAMFVAMIAKRIRKYYGGLMAATQQVSDLDGKHGVALINQATYKFLLSTDGPNLKRIHEIFNFSDAIKTKLGEGLRGQGLLIAGREKVWANIEVEPYERKYFPGK